MFLKITFLYKFFIKIAIIKAYNVIINIII